MYNGRLSSTVNRLNLYTLKRIRSHWGTESSDQINRPSRTSGTIRNGVARSSLSKMIRFGSSQTATLNSISSRDTEQSICQEGHRDPPERRASTVVARCSDFCGPETPITIRVEDNSSKR